MTTTVGDEQLEFQLAFIFYKEGGKIILGNSTVRLWALTCFCPPAQDSRIETVHYDTRVALSAHLKQIHSGR